MVNTAHPSAALKERMATFIFICMCGLSVAGRSTVAVRAEDKPVELVGLENSRAALQTGRVVWSIRSNMPRTQREMIPRWHFYDVPRYFTSRFTPGECAVEDNGDPEGVVWRRQDGSPEPELGYRGMRFLWCDGAQWEHRDRAGHGRVDQGRRDMIDVRTFGLVCRLPLGDTSHGAIWGAGADRVYTKRVIDGLHEVTAYVPENDSTIRWLIDPERGWNAVQVSVSLRGELVEETRTTLRQFGNVWFPETIEFYETRFEQGRKPVNVVQVLSAEFNDPDHPRRLTPESIGIEVGTNLDVFTADDPFHSIGRFGWDAEKLVPLDELHRRVHARELKLGEVFVLETDRALARGQWIERLETGWERYTRHFINRYRLDAEQTQKAWSILDDCQKRAQAYFGAHQRQIDTIQAKVRNLSGSDKPQVVDEARLLGKLKQQMLRLEAPIADIFYRELVPRLSRLPTRAQRNAVEAPAKNEKKP